MLVCFLLVVVVMKEKKLEELGGKEERVVFINPRGIHLWKELDPASIVPSSQT